MKPSDSNIEDRSDTAAASGLSPSASRPSAATSQGHFSPRDATPLDAANQDSDEEDLDDQDSDEEDLDDEESDEDQDDDAGTDKPTSAAVVTAQTGVSAAAVTAAAIAARAAWREGQPPPDQKAAGVSETSGLISAARKPSSQSGGSSREGRSHRNRSQKPARQSKVSASWLSWQVFALLGMFLFVTVPAGVFGYRQYQKRQDLEAQQNQAREKEKEAQEAAVRAAQAETLRQRNPRDVITRVLENLHKANPRYNNEHQVRVAEGRVTGLVLLANELTDISALAELTDLETLNLAVLQNRQVAPPRTGPAISLEPLRGLKLKTLHLWGSQVANLSPLEDMPLKELIIGGTSVRDLGPLRRCESLEILQINQTDITDLSPLAGLPQLKKLYAGKTKVSDLRPLARLNLTHLNVAESEVSSLTALAGMPLEHLMINDNAKLGDLSPLKSLPKLRRLFCSIRTVEDQNLLRQLTALESLNNMRPSDALERPLGSVVTSEPRDGQATAPEMLQGGRPSQETEQPVLPPAQPKTPSPNTSP